MEQEVTNVTILLNAPHHDSAASGYTVSLARSAVPGYYGGLKRWWWDKITKNRKQRWIVALALASVYMFQAIYVGGISTTNLLVPIYSLFPFAPVLLRPNGALHSKDSLPVYSSDEFKPFIPKLPEYTFWCIWMVAFTVALMLSFSWHAQFFAFVLCGGITVLGPPIKSMMTHKHLQFNFCKLVYKKKKTKKHE